jgi:hypothetical protein
VLLVFVGGLLAGGLTTGLVLWFVGGLARPLSTTVAVSILGGACLIAILREFGVLRFSLPERRALIPQDVFRRHPLVAGGQFGFELGTGVRTYLPSTAPYVLAIALLLLGAPLAATAAAGLGFGLGRAAMPLSRRLRGDVDDWDESLARWTPRIKQCATCLIVLGALSVAIVGS